MLRFCKLALPLLFVSALFAGDAPPALKLDDAVRPTRYAADLTLVPGQKTFSGTVDIDINLSQSTSLIWLNGVQIQVREATLQQNGKELTATVQPGNEDFFGLHFKEEVATGPAKLHIRYEAEISDNSSAGVFTGHDSGNTYLLTQFESIDARRAFPCFDQPDFKTPWQLTLHVRKEDGAFTNTPQVSESEEPNGMRKVVFAESKPLPSYLVAFTVGPFDVVDAGKAGRNHTPIRILAPKGKAYQAKYAAEVTGLLLARLEDYFGMAYPYEKLDSVAIPQIYGFGAMENAGLITYGQTIILADPAIDTDSRRRGYASVAAHEMAHQWFGDLVTLKWWDDTWLNESFATWTSAKIIAAIRPDWNSRLGDLGGKFGAMEQDSLVSARQIRQPIESKDDISNAFDGITYQKGAAVIRMFESWTGEARFQKGVRGYLKQYAYKNAKLGDFLDSISSAGEPRLHQAFSTFLLQPGVPLVTASLDCSGAPTLKLSQKRYLPIGSKGDSSKNWETPVCVRYHSAHGEETECFLLDKPSAEFTLKKASSCPSSLNANADAAGYYIVKYDGDLQTSVLKHSPELNAAERRSYLNDLRALAGAGEIKQSFLLAALPNFANSPERQIVSETQGIAEDANQFVSPDLEPNYERYLAKLFGARAEKLGWKAAPADDAETRLLRTSLVPFVARWAKIPSLDQQAYTLAVGWLKDRKGVDPDMLNGVLSVAAYFGDRALFDTMVAELKKIEDRRQRQAVIQALSKFGDPELSRAGLDLLIHSNIDMRETAYMIFGPLGSKKTERLPFEFVKEHYEEIVKRAPRGAGSEYGAILTGVGGLFCDDPSRREFVAFFEDKAGRFTGGPRLYAHSLETIDLCQARKAIEEADINTFFRAQ